jgi:hypothetical protein
MIMITIRLGGPPPAHSMAGLLRAALAGMALVCPAHHAHAQAGGVPDVRPAFKYLLTEPPPASASAALPPGAGKPLVARVRVLVIGSEIGGPPTERTKNHVLGATIEVVATIRGTAPACQRTLQGCLLYPRFQPRGSASRSVFPYPDRPARGEYFVLGYVDPDGILALHGFPASAAEYEAWSRERWGQLTTPPRRG